MSVVTCGPGSTKRVPEDFAWDHALEGADDMPAHVKGTITGFELTLPVTPAAAWTSEPGRASTCASTATTAA